MAGTAAAGPVSAVRAGATAASDPAAVAAAGGTATADRIAATADRVGIAADRVAATVDRVAATADRVGLAADPVAVTTDRVAPTADCVAVAADRVAMTSNRVAATSRFGADVAVTPRRESRRFLFSLATREDDAELRALLGKLPFDGEIRVTLEREPSIIEASTIDGDVSQTLVARDRITGRIVAMGTRSERAVYANGSVGRVGYLGQLRIVPELRQHRAILLEGFAACRALHDAGRVRFYVASIVSDNHRAARLLTAPRLQQRPERPDGLPRFREYARIETLVLPTTRVRDQSSTPGGVRIVRGTDRMLPAIVACLERNHRRFQLAPRWRVEDLRSRDADERPHVEESPSSRETADASWADEQASRRIARGLHAEDLQPRETARASWAGEPASAGATVGPHADDRRLNGLARGLHAEDLTSSGLARGLRVEGQRSNGLARGLRVRDFFVACRGEEVVGCLARWDQRRFKQVRVCGYAPWLARWRRAVNLLAPLLGMPRLPPAGALLNFAYLSHVAIDGDDPRVLGALVDAARSVRPARTASAASALSAASAAGAEPPRDDPARAEQASSDLAPAGPARTKSLAPDGPASSDPASAGLARTDVPAGPARTEALAPHGRASSEPASAGPARTEAPGLDEPALDYVVLGLAVGHPLLAAFARRRVRRYVSQLYLVSWEDGRAAIEALDGRLPHVEVATL